MPYPLRSRLVVQIALVALIAVTAAEASGAYLNMFERSPLVIFDDPAAPSEDEVLWMSSPASETWGFAAPPTSLAVRTWRPLARSTALAPGGSSGVRSDITRAPPRPNHLFVGR